MAFLGIPPPSFNLAWWQAVLTGVAAVASLLAGAAALIALSYFRNQARSASQTIGIDCLWKLIENWDSEVMRSRRARAARALSRKPEPEFTQDVLDVVNVFELVGFLVYEANVVAVPDAWANFSTWAGPYWCASEPVIAEQRSADPTLWEQYARLRRGFDDIDRQKQHLKPGTPIPYEADISGFLTDESGLG